MRSTRSNYIVYALVAYYAVFCALPWALAEFFRKEKKKGGVHKSYRASADTSAKPSTEGTATEGSSTETAKEPAKKASAEGEVGVGIDLSSEDLSEQSENCWHLRKEGLEDLPLVVAAVIFATLLHDTPRDRLGYLDTVIWASLAARLVHLFSSLSANFGRRVTLVLRAAFVGALLYVLTDSAWRLQYRYFVVAT